VDSRAEATLLDYGIIADVSATLEQLLTGALAPIGSVAEVHDLQGIIPVIPARLTLFLFEISEDASARNRPRLCDVVPGPPPRLTIRKPPMALLLRYLLTPWSGDRPTDQRILGRAMQVLYDNAIVSGPALAGGLAGTDQALKISVASLTVEERARVWYSVQKPYRVSVAYEVRVVNLVSEVVGEVSTVSDRSLGYAMAESAP
jgi:uncharacterized protein DUF4255